MCDILTNFDIMARDDMRTTIMGENYLSGNWRETAGEEKTELIHSGHFMVSDPFKEKSERPGYNFKKYASSSTSATYRFNQPDLEIDSSFAKLFECLNLAYTGCKIVSPKWKTFKGQKVRLQDKIRLNNAIWREWHNQFIIGKKPFLCHFSLPALDNEFIAPSAVVLEGKYGKRTTTAVIGEYQKWRAFYLKQQRKALLRDGDPMDTSQSMFSDRDFFSATGQAPMVLDEDTLLSEFSDTLFSSLNQSFVFPNPREFSHAGVIVDAIQPGLVGLQPPLEELMDTLDVLPEIRVGNQNAPFIFTAGDQSSSQNDILTMVQTQLQPQVQSMPPPPPLQQQLRTSDLDPMLVSSSDILQQADGSLVGQDLDSIMLNQMPSPMDALPQVGPPPLIIPQQQQLAQAQLQQNQLQQTLQNPTAATSLMLTPQLLGQLLQMQQQADQKNTQQPTILNLDGNLLSGLNLNLGGSGLQGLGAGLVFQTQQQNLSQQQPQQQQQSQKLQQQPHKLPQQPARSAVPVKLTRAMDVDSSPPPNRTLTQSPLGVTRTVPKGQNRIVISSPAQQQDTRGKTGGGSGRLSAQQIQLLQQSAQNIIQQQQQSSLMPKSEQTNYMRSFGINSAPSSPSPTPSPTPTQVPPRRSRIKLTASQQQPSTSATVNQKKAADQNQALKLLQKVASHVSQSNSTNKNLFNDEQQTLFNRIFGGESMEAEQSVPRQCQSSSRQAKTPPAATQPAIQPRQRAQQPPVSQHKTVVFQTNPVGSTNTGTTTVNSKDSHRKARMKQTVVTKKPILKVVPASTGKANSSALLTHLLTGGKYDPNSGIVLKAPSPASTAASVPVSNMAATSVKASSRTSILKSKVNTSCSPSILSPVDTASRMVPVISTTASDSNSSDPTLFTIGATGFSTVELKAEHADSSEDKNIPTAEQRRRTNIRTGFELLHQLIPSVSQNPQSKVSKAAMLQKSVDYIKKLQAEKSQLSEEMSLLKDEINTLNTAISESQSQLPASGVPVTRQRYDQMRDNFDEYVRERTEQNWKFWIFSIIIRPLFESFNGTVSTASREELCRTVLSWLDRHCSLLALRPTVLSSLTMLSRITSILSDPTQVPQQAVQAVHKRDRANSAD